MGQLLNSRNRTTGLLAAATFISPIELLEGRVMMAVHVIGSAIVYPTIQAAVDAAPIGATIRVDAGTYDELVTINKSLTLQGATNNQSIVDGQDFGGGAHSTAIYITGNDVTLNGFTIQGDTSSGKYGAGVVIAPGVSGTHVLNNVIQHNVAGLYLANASSTDPAIIRGNVFAYNNNPGDNNGRGIYSDGGVSGGSLTNVQIDGNTFIGNVGDGTSGNPEAAIGLEAQTVGRQSNITITNNTMTGNGKGVLLYNLTNGVIANNSISSSTDTTSGAIRIEGNVNGLTIKSNNLCNNLGAAIRITTRFVGPSSNITINNNNITGNAAGLIVDPGAYTGTLDARYNWWGCLFGPSVNGTGSGDTLVTNGNSVNYAPWSLLPIVGAGPQTLVSSLLGLL